MVSPMASMRSIEIRTAAARCLVMVRSLLHQSGKFLLRGFDGAGIGYGGKVFHSIKKEDWNSVFSFPIPSTSLI